MYIEKRQFFLENKKKKEEEEAAETVKETEDRGNCQTETLVDEIVYSVL